MKHRSTSTIDRAGRASLVPWESLEDHAPTAFTLAGASLLASLFVPVGLSVIIDRAWLVGIALVGFGVLAAAIGLLGLQPRVSAGTPRLAVAGTAFGTTAGVAGSIVVGLTVLTAASVHLPTMDVPVGKPTFVVLSLTMAAGYGLGFLTTGVGMLRSRSTPGLAGELMVAGGFVLLVPVIGGTFQLALGIALPAWIALASLGLAAVDTLLVGLSLRSAN